MQLHPALEPVAFLLGTWRGQGEGSYPTIEPFTYGEELTFHHVGKPSIAYTQRTWLPDGTPSHAEVGYWRPHGERVELVLAHPTGVTEIAVGTVTGTVIELESARVGVSPSAKPVTALRRRYEVDGDIMVCETWMAAVGRDMTQHLSAQLRRS